MCGQPSYSLPSACFTPKKEEMDSAIITRGKASRRIHCFHLPTLIILIAKPAIKSRNALHLKAVSHFSPSLSTTSTELADRKWEN